MTTTTKNTASMASRPLRDTSPPKEHVGYALQTMRGTSCRLILARHVDGTPICVPRNCLSVTRSGVVDLRSQGRSNHRERELEAFEMPPPQSMGAVRGGRGSQDLQADMMTSLMLAQCRRWQPLESSQNLERRFGEDRYVLDVIYAPIATTIQLMLQHHPAGAWADLILLLASDRELPAPCCECNLWVNQSISCSRCS